MLSDEFCSRASWHLSPIPTSCRSELSRIECDFDFERSRRWTRVSSASRSKSQGRVQIIRLTKGEVENKPRPNHHFHFLRCRSPHLVRLYSWFPSWTDTMRSSRSEVGGMRYYGGHQGSPWNSLTWEHSNRADECWIGCKWRGLSQESKSYGSSRVVAGAGRVK